MSLADELHKLQELHRSGALSDTEFAAAKARLLAEGPGDDSAMSDWTPQAHLEEIKLDNEVARLDRQWALERERYMVPGRYGHRYIPSRAMSVVSGIVIVAFGLFWMAMTASMSRGFGGIFSVFPLFGVIFILAGLGMSVYAYTKAGQYERAYRTYQRRRSKLVSEKDSDE